MSLPVTNPSHTKEQVEKAFGPVPSRRLGQSLGINNIPPKTCTYSCVYCQVGRTTRCVDSRRVFYEPKDVLKAVKTKVDGITAAGEAIDYLSFVPTGEPTLDLNLAREIAMLKELGIKIAVITNASLLWDPDVRNDLKGADWVSVKIDAAREQSWRKVNRPHKALRLQKILNGVADFAGEFQGDLVSETMLVDGINDESDDIHSLAEFIGRLGPKTAYLSVPVRPPSEDWVRPPSEASIIKAKEILESKIRSVECLTAIRNDDLHLPPGAEKEILSITAVHPLKKEQVTEYLKKAGEDWSLVARLVAEGRLIEKNFGKNLFYFRRFH